MLHVHSKIVVNAGAEACKSLEQIFKLKAKNLFQSQFRAHLPGTRRPTVQTDPDLQSRIRIRALLVNHRVERRLHNLQRKAR